MNRIRTSSGPIDRVAARVIRPGIHYEKQLPDGCKHWREVQPTIPFVVQRHNPQSRDLTGERFGLFTVVGYLGRVGPLQGGRRTAMWLVRCACGDYESRSAKAIKNTANAEDRCIVCRSVEFHRSGSSDPREWFQRKAASRA